MTGIDILMKVARKEDLTDSERNTLYEWASGHDVSKTCVDGLFSGRTEITELSQIAENFGSATSGEVVFGESGNPNNDPPDFTGVAMSYPGYTRGSSTFYIIGEEGGVLKFGLASDGSAVFLGGNATVSESGITITGLQRGIILSATSDAGVAKQAYVQMKTIDEDATARPVLSIGYEEPGTTELVVDGTFEQGDFTYWTKSVSAGGNTDWIEIQNTNPSAQAGSYCAKYQDTDGGGSTGTLTSVSRFAITAGQDYQISLWLWSTMSTGNAERCTISVSFWAASSGGSAIATETLPTSVGSAVGTWIEPGGNGKVITAPVGANYASVAIGMYSQGGIVAVDNVSLLAVNSWGEIILDPDDSKPLFRGSKTDSELLQIPIVKATIPAPFAAPTVAISAGGGLVNGTSYKYKYTFLTDTGETTASAESAEVTATAVNKTVSVTDMFPEMSVTGVAVYRADKPSGGAYGSFYFIGLGSWIPGEYNLFDDNDPAPTTAEEPEYNSARDNPCAPLASQVMSDLEIQVAGTGRNYVLDASQVYGFYRGASVANSNDLDSCVLPLFIAAGTYTMTTVGLTSSSRGKIDYYIDGVSVATGQDWYSAGVTYNVEKTASVTISTSGYHKLRWVVNGKNAAATDYAFGYTFIKFTPSAY